LWIEGIDFVQLIKEIRRQLQLSQGELARELGVSYATVNRWENRRFVPSSLALERVEAWCDLMAAAGRRVLPRLLTCDQIKP